MLLRMETLVSKSFLRPEFSMASSNGMDFHLFLAQSDVQSLVFGHEDPQLCLGYLLCCAKHGNGWS